MGSASRMGRRAKRKVKWVGVATGWQPTVRLETKTIARQIWMITLRRFVRISLAAFSVLEVGLILHDKSMEWLIENRWSGRSVFIKFFLKIIGNVNYFPPGRWFGSSGRTIN